MSNGGFTGGFSSGFSSGFRTGLAGGIALGLLGAGQRIFVHDEFLFGDEIAFAQYRQEHWLEHIQFVQIGQMQPTGAILIPDLDFTSWGTSQGFKRNWLVSHEGVHEILRGITGVPGINLADVNLDNEYEFYTWLDAHRNEHDVLRQAFGIQP